MFVLLYLFSLFNSKEKFFESKKLIFLDFSYEFPARVCFFLHKELSNYLFSIKLSRYSETSYNNIIITISILFSTYNLLRFQSVPSY